MPERDGYIPGVPCWIDTTQPDPEAAVDFYSRLFGWEFEDVMPPGSPNMYFVARVRGLDVAAVGSVPESAPPTATWNTYVWVENADLTAAKVIDAGGTVLIDPFDIPGAGRMAVCADAEGAAFSVWQADGHRGARIVNEAGALNFNDLHTWDVGGAKAFYGSVFGWETLELDGGLELWTLEGYGDHRERDDPEIRRRVAEYGGPQGFEDVVASMSPITEDRPHVPAHWGVTLGVDDADAVARKTAELGGTVVVAPFDAPWVRMTVLADPQGAQFVASAFVPENRDTRRLDIGVTAA